MSELLNVIASHPVLVGLVGGTIIFGVFMVNALFAVYAERKVSAFMQDRLGPMHVGPYGTLQTVADAIKLLLKEDIVPAAADGKLFRMAPYLVFLSAFLTYIVFPFDKNLIPADLNLGIYYAMSVSSLVVIGIIMASWPSNNKWSLLGGMRSAAQIVSYEIPVGLTLLLGVMVSGSLSLREMGMQQQGWFWHWYLFRNPVMFLGFFAYFTASLAEVNRTPFDLPEAESELVAGYLTEYSGMRWALFFLSEYGNMFAVSAISTTVFLGAWNAPAPFLEFIPGVFWFLGKVYFLIFVQMWLRWTFPRVRVDQLMFFSWRFMVPLSFLLVLLAGLLELWFPNGWWG